MKKAAISLLATVALANADTLVLRSGSRVDGSYVGGDNRTVRFLVGNQVNTYNLTDVGSIQFNEVIGSAAAGPPPANSQSGPNGYWNSPDNSNGGPPPQQQTYNAPPPGPQDNGYGQQPPPPPQGGFGQQPAAQSPYGQQPPAPIYGSPANNGAPGPTRGLEVPAGSSVVVRLIDPVNSDTDRLGQTYRASVDEPVVVSGQTVIPRGADAVVSLVSAQQAGKFEGRTVMTLGLRSVTVNGSTFVATTSAVQQASASRSTRSAEVVGGTAALGAIIGALAGGGRGAAIGAVSGGAVGAAAQVYTSGQKVKVPSETRLNFTLQNPLEL